jgi:hypothetical protein
MVTMHIILIIKLIFIQLAYKMSVRSVNVLTPERWTSLVTAFPTDELLTRVGNRL